MSRVFADRYLDHEIVRAQCSWSAQRQLAAQMAAEPEAIGRGLNWQAGGVADARYPGSAAFEPSGSRRRAHWGSRRYRNNFRRG